MDKLFKIFYDFWILIGADLMPDYIEKILYYVVFAIIVIIALSPFWLFWLLVKVFGAVGGYNE